MKKTLCVIVTLCVIALGAFAQGNGVIRELTGEVELKPAGASAFVPARVGSEVARDTIVSTGFKGTAIIVVGSSTIAVKPLTRLSLSEIQVNSGNENLNLNLQAGRVRVDVKPPEGTRTNFTVQSPSATASVRGTSFEFDTLNLKVLEGTVSYQGTYGMAMPVGAGSESTLRGDGSAVDPVELAAGNLQPIPPTGTDTGTSTPSPMNNVSGVTGDVGLDLGY